MPITKVTPQGDLSAATARQLWLLAGKQAGLGRGVLVFTASPTSGGQSALGPQVTGRLPARRAAVHPGGYPLAGHQSRTGLAGPKSLLLLQWAGVIPPPGGGMWTDRAVNEVAIEVAIRSSSSIIKYPGGLKP